MLENIIKKLKINWFVFLLCFCFVFCFIFLFSCSRKNGKLFNNKLNVVVTVFPIYDFVSEISSSVYDDYLNLKMLIPPGVDSHSFEPTPSDIESIENCDLLIYVGGPEDMWLNKILNSIDNEKKSKIKTLNLLECLGLSSSSKEVDYHIWTSLSNSLKIIEIIRDVLVKLDPNYAEFYMANSEGYMNAISALKKEFHNLVLNSKRRTLVVADKFPFKYFAEEFGLEVKTPFLNCSSKSEASMSEIGKIIQFVKKNSIPVILKIDGEVGEMANTISRETGAKVATFYVCHTISKQDFSQIKKADVHGKIRGQIYLSFLKKNLEILKEALN